MNRRHFLALAAASASQAAPPNQDRNLSAQPRIRRKFNAGWLFRRQVHGGGALGSWERDPTLGAAIEPAFLNARLPAYDDSAWPAIQLPHSWNQHDGSDELPGYFRGIGWYRKHFQLESELSGKRVFLEFEGVNQVSEFWVNGSYVGKHEGGYTSFEFDITPHVKFGPAGNVLTVKVDNIYNKDIAPTVKTDLTFYGGIYRDVWLRVAAPIHLSEVYWLTPKVSESAAEIEVRSKIDNRTARAATLRVLHEILDAQGLVVAKVETSASVPAQKQGHALTQRLTLAQPKLWSPDTPHLYKLRTTLLDPAGPGDIHDAPIGFRWFRFDAQQGFFLNGRRLQLRGTTWHQSYPGLGSALPNSRHVKDMELIKEMGCNLFRTSHYPHDPAVMEACDRLGLLVLEEMFVGEEVEDDGGYYRIQAKGIEEMIARDRNNPCVFMWGLEGEVESAAKHVEVVQQLVNKIKATDPSRPATMQDARIDSIKQTLDVVGLYSGFDENDKERSLHPERRYMIEEYTVDAIGRGIYGMGPESEDLGCDKHEAYLAEVGRRPWIAGSTVWHQFDYDGDEYDPITPHLVTFGLADFWRIPKDVFYLFQSQWSAKPMLHICGHWTWPGEEGKTRKVKVYSNQPRVELFLNGRSLGAREPVAYPGLDHPPFLWDVPYEPGVLKAVSGALTSERKTAGPAARIDLRSDVERIESRDPESLAYLTASVVDKDGTVVPTASHAISFTAYGPGELLPQTWPGHPTGLTWNCVAGLTRIALRSTDRVGRCVVSAYSPGLRMGRAILDVAAPGKRDQMEYRGGATVYK